MAVGPQGVKAETTRLQPDGFESEPHEVHSEEAHNFGQPQWHGDMPQFSNHWLMLSQIEWSPQGIHTLADGLEARRWHQVSTLTFSKARDCALLFILYSEIQVMQDERRPKNVIVFGELGAGKSSVVNMLADDEFHARAQAGNSLTGVTDHPECFRRRIDDRIFHVYDTPGLDEALGGTVAAAEAIRSLYRLMVNLDDGIHLLVFVVRGPGITKSHHKNYDLFYRVFCQKQVPIVLFLTHMEDAIASDEVKMWQETNCPTLTKMQFSFNGEAYITADPGPNGVRKKQYDVSVEPVKRLIKQHCRDDPWILSNGTIPWLKKVVVETYNQIAAALGLQRMVLNETLYDLLKIAGLSEKQARALGNEIAIEIHVEREKRELERKKERKSKQKKSKNGSGMRNGVYMQ